MSELAVAVAIGIAFGWALERAGLGDARKLVGQFYFTDFTVFKVMFSAIVVAMLGAFWLGRLGVVDLSRVAIPDTYLLPQLAGGVIFGAGFVIAGLCPGTSCVAAASGRADGIAVILGMFAGVLLTGLAFAPLAGFYESTARGALTLPQLLGVPYGVVVAAVVAVAAAGFWAAEAIERGWRPAIRRGGSQRPSPAPAPSDVERRPSGRRVALTIPAVLLGALALFAGSPYRARLDVERLARAVARQEDHVTALELAAWIRDRKPGLRVLDLRTPAEFDAGHIPRAERVALESLASTPFRAGETLVLISAGGAHAAQAWVFLQALGNRQVYFLRGGQEEWEDEVMHPRVSSELTRYFGSVPRGDGPPARRSGGC
jgi:rhodanese-related sulfurtransferase/uncharacterized membrane protein YedE/YeeE